MSRSVSGSGRHTERNGEVLVYRMLRWGHEYVDKGMQYDEEQHREQQIGVLEMRAATLGLVV
jgi:hypothetical protein